MIQPQVSQIRVEPMIISRQQHLARKTNKMINWLRLLGMHRDNNNYAQIDTILSSHLHDHFIMTEAFWNDYVDSKVEQGCSKQSIQLMVMALEDGPFFAVGSKIVLALVGMFASKQVGLNYCLSVIQKCIGLFEHDRKNGSQFYKILRSLYLEMRDERKVRESYEREIKGAFNDFDMVYHQYQRWEKNNELRQKSKDMYRQTNQRWELESAQFDETLISSKSPRSIRRSLFNLENQNTSQVNREKYLNLLELLPTQSERLWFLRRMALSYKGEWMSDYLKKVEGYHQSDEQLVIRKFKAAITICADEPSLQKKYLKYLLRRINPHLRDYQLPQEYSQLWGERVSHFRTEITEMINKQHKTMLPEQRKKLSMEYWDLWLLVEQQITKDKATLCQIYETIVSQESNIKYYQRYADSMIRLGAVNDAKNVLRRYIRHQKGWKSRQKYRNFINLYGNFEEEQTFEEQEKLITPVLPQTSQRQAGTALSRPTPSTKLETIITGNPQPKQAQPPILDAGKRVSEHKDEVSAKIESATRKRLHIDGDCTLYLRGIPLTWGESDVLGILLYRKHVIRVTIVVKDGEQKDYCYVQYDDEDIARRELDQNKSGFKLSLSQPPADFDQSKTLFLCALPLSTTQQKIKQIFANHCPHITDIRLLLNREKNIAYVDFDTAEHKEQAFTQAHNQNNLKIDNKRIIIQYADSHRQKTKRLLQVVFLKNLPYKAREEDLHQFFGVEKVKQAYIPRENGGKSKGFGYVEFNRFIDYQEVIDKKKGQLFGKQFTILKSDRSITQPQRSSSHSPKLAPQNGSRDKSGHRGGHHSRNGRGGARGARSNGSGDNEQKRDNNFFRNLMK